MPTTRIPRRLAAATLALLLLTGASACGASGGEDDAADDPTTTVAGGSDTTEGADDTVDEPDDTTDTTEDEPTDTTEPDGPVEGGDRDAYVDALVSTFDEDDDEIFTVDQVQCLAERFVDAIGPDAFAEAGVSPADVAADDDVLDTIGIDEPTAREMVDGFSACDIDLRELFLDQFGGEDLTPEQQACLEDTLTDEVIAESFVLDITGDESADDPFDAASACLFDEAAGAGD